MPVLLRKAAKIYQDIIERPELWIVSRVEMGEIQTECRFFRKNFNFICIHTDIIRNRLTNDSKER